MCCFAPSDSISQASKNKTNITFAANAVSSFTVDFDLPDGQRVLAVAGVRTSQITMLDIAYWEIDGDSVTVGIRNAGSQRTGSATVTALVGPA